ncbi:hypothetical protein Aglo01_13540 [Actinokineospora globicatena]|nr:hypothetical protein Aglo01_13540 [Actinokineospora globicatena]GLW83705.1 hypothetical protein Aglo02_13450 [Actinokineospora globicatena]
MDTRRSPDQQRPRHMTPDTPTPQAGAANLTRETAAAHDPNRRRWPLALQPARAPLPDSLRASAPRALPASLCASAPRPHRARSAPPAPDPTEPASRPRAQATPAQPPPSLGGVPGPVYRGPPTVDLESTPAVIHMWITSVTHKSGYRREINGETPG